MGQPAGRAEADARAPVAGALHRRLPQAGARPRRRHHPDRAGRGREATRRPSRRARPPCAGSPSEARRRARWRRCSSGEADGNDAYLEVHAGAGGTESQDWAEMLAAHVPRWAEARGYKVTLVEASAGEEAGLKSATLVVKGENAYGWLKTRMRRAPAGAHLALRLQRAAAHQLRQRLGLSGGRRHHRDRHQGERLPHRHLPRVRRRRPARQQDGLGGAHHAHPHQHRGGEPAGALAASRTARSPGRCCKSRLYELELQKREEKANAEAAAKTDIGWGHQIRSYVLQPYQLVKDLRTGVQSSDPQRRARRRHRRLHRVGARPARQGRRPGRGGGYRLDGILDVSGPCAPVKAGEGRRWPHTPLAENLLGCDMRLC